MDDLEVWRLSDLVVGMAKTELQISSQLPLQYSVEIDDGLVVPKAQDIAKEDGSLRRLVAEFLRHCIEVSSPQPGLS